MQLSALNNAALGAIHLVAVRIDDAHRSICDLGRRLDTKLDTILVELQQQHRTATANAAATTATATAAAAPAQPRNPRADFQPLRVPPTQMQLQGGPQQPGAGTAALQNGNEILLAIPLVPDFPAALPATMTRLLQEHFDHHLSRYEEAYKPDWTPAVQVAYSSLIYLFKKIQVQAHHFRSEEDFMALKMPRAAAILYSQRAGISLNQYMNALKAADPATITRRKRQRD
jgi:hypothetical protein